MMSRVKHGDKMKLKSKSSGLWTRGSWNYFPNGNAKNPFLTPHHRVPLEVAAIEDKTLEKDKIDCRAALSDIIHCSTPVSIDKVLKSSVIITSDTLSGVQESRDKKWDAIFAKLTKSKPLYPKNCSAPVKPCNLRKISDPKYSYSKQLTRKHPAVKKPEESTIETKAPASGGSCNLIIPDSSTSTKAKHNDFNISPELLSENQPQKSRLKAERPIKELFSQVHIKVGEPHKKPESTSMCHAHRCKSKPLEPPSIPIKAKLRYRPNNRPKPIPIPEIKVSEDKTEDAQNRILKLEKKIERKADEHLTGILAGLDLDRKWNWVLSKHQINYLHFLKLTEKDLVELGMTRSEEINKVLEFIAETLDNSSCQKKGLGVAQSLNSELTTDEVDARMKNMTLHISRLHEGTRDLKAKIKLDPSGLRYGKETFPVSKIILSIKELLLSLKITSTECRMLQDALISCNFM